MTEWLALAYPYVKWLHIVALVSWMAGLFYLPRLFVHHVESAPADAQALFADMERKLLKVIMNPAMIVTWISGFALMIGGNWGAAPWLWVKVFLVLCMTAFHGFCGRWRKELAAGTNTRDGRFFRVANEVPTVLLIAIVGLVTVKPF